MKVNTDGVLLGAVVSHPNPKVILDIGTGTGVIAMMLAQRFSQAKVDAVEIDAEAAKTAYLNFNDSLFKERLCLYASSFQQHFERIPEQKYDLIVSNPPFFIGSLKSDIASKALARHTDKYFFESLLKSSSSHLNQAGIIELILPLETATLVKELGSQIGLTLQKQVFIKSFSDSIPHREIIRFGFEQKVELSDTVTIYNKPKKYTLQYQSLLKPYLTIF